jgi:hypothetical protein
MGRKPTVNRQDRREHRASIGFESLEGRSLLSTASGRVAPPKAAGISSVDLQGSVQGAPSTVVGNPDVGTTVDFRGSGDVLGVGRAKLSGALHGTGFIASSHVEGAITLANANGSLTLQVQSPSKGGFTAPASGTYTYSVTKGTGAFKRDSGDGTIRLTLGPRSFAMTFQGGPDVS